MPRTATRAFASLLIVGLTAGAAAAQSSESGGQRRVSFDTVVGVQDMLFEDVAWPMQIIVDSAATWQVGRRLFANLRPVVWRVNGEWETLLDQASLRYEAGRDTRVRVEAGRFPSPIGLGMTENRASVNPGVLWCHRLYYSPLPSLGPGMPLQSLVSASYPVGVTATVTTSAWDARAALLDRAPVDFWTAPTRLQAPTHVVVGGGFTPKQGLRVGVAGAWGELRDAASAASDYRMLNVEADWAFDDTRLSGEWTRDRFETSRGGRTAYGWTAQVRQTLTPRWFVHSRATRGSSPQVAATGGVTPRTYLAIDSTLGYLLSPELTVRAGHTALRGWRSPVTDHQLGVSLVWAQRWR
ncbi:MAG TPA: hypothetical protein VMW48_05095 [Vicinamibacterales bacterium]|nr:hypothetical protein [Vicinamibacterales bacterium]